MKILLVGSGGREHALAWKIKQSPLVKTLVIAPGNPGMASLGELHDLNVTDVEGLTALAVTQKVDLVVVGPESALAVGLADALLAHNIPCFGPEKAAAQLEASKAFTKDLCARYDIPTASYGKFETPDAALDYLKTLNAPYVIKADGLAAGKGVVIAETLSDAEAAINDMLGGKFGTSGARVVIEEFMMGEEASVFALSDGKTALLFGQAQDHKRAYDGDKGPNTGGMGTYSPAPIATADILAQARDLIIAPTVAAMRQEGYPYKGVLYAGLMVDQGKARLVEYNARFGDPECQVLMMRLKSDLVPYLLAAATGRLHEMTEPEWRDEVAICVVFAAKGYPEAPITDTVISGADVDFGDDVVVFHAGTKRDAEGQLLAAGGRVLNICARGVSVNDAREKAYAAIKKIDWPEGFYRTDIGWRAL